MPELRNVTQAEAVMAFERLGGTVRAGKGSHQVIKMPNGVNLSVPSGVVKIGLLKHLIRSAQHTEDEFMSALRGR